MILFIKGSSKIVFRNGREKKCKLCIRPKTFDRNVHFSPIIERYKSSTKTARYYCTAVSPRVCDPVAGIRRWSGSGFCFALAEAIRTTTSTTNQQSTIKITYSRVVPSFLRRQYNAVRFGVDRAPYIPRILDGQKIRTT